VSVPSGGHRLTVIPELDVFATVTA
jgi:hypothetical protein